MFRFEDLEIWKRGIVVLDEILNIADVVEERHLHKFSQQLRGAGLSITNNIAEGSGCDTALEFKKFLGYARRSVFEVVSILILFERRKYTGSIRDIKERLEELSKMISAFKKSL